MFISQTFESYPLFTTLALTSLSSQSILSLESNEKKKAEETELSDEAKVTLERIKKGEVFKF